MKVLQMGLGGHPFFANDDLTHLNEAIKETADTLGILLGNNYFISNTFVSKVGSNYVCAAGVLVYKGEICYFDAQSVADVVGRIPAWIPDLTYRANNPLQYANGEMKSPHVIKKVKLEMIDLGSPPADYVTYNLFAQKGTAILSTFKAQFVQIGNGGTAKTVNWNNSSLPSQAFIRRNVIQDALVYSHDYEFKGGLTSANLNINQFDATILFTLPANLRPTRNLLGCVAVIIRINEADASLDRHYSAACRLTTDGDFIVYMPGNAANQKVVVYLDGLVLHDQAFIGL